MKSEKSIFLACSIGAENSEIRKHSDTILEYLVREAIQHHNEFDDIQVIRADEIAQSGKITSQILTLLQDATVCVADLTGSNPNVLFELGYRQALRKPYIMMATSTTVLPFDLKDSRCIFYNTADPKSMAQARDLFRKFLRIALKGEIDQYDAMVIGSTPDPEKTNLRLLETLETMVEAERVTSSSVDSLSQRLNTTVSRIEQLFATGYKGSGTYLYIDGEHEAFSALVAALSRARETIRTTRFSPFSVGNRQPDFAKMISCRVLGNDNKFPPVQDFFRIVAANNISKLDDVREYIKCFVGKPFTLYLTPQSSSFELVIIDSAEVFLHFHGRDKVIASTLHIISEQVAKKFIDIFSWLIDPSLHPQIERIDFRYRHPSNRKEIYEQVDRFFQKHCPASSGGGLDGEGNCGDC